MTGIEPVGEKTTGGGQSTDSVGTGLPGAGAGQPKEGAGGHTGASCAELDATKPLTLYQSSDDSNSMASPVIVRQMVNAHSKYVGGRVRPYEFLNYYNVAYDTPPPGQLRIVSQLRPASVSGDFILQVGIQSAPTGGVRRKGNYVLVLDTSGSMMGQRIAREKAVVRAVATRFQQGDVVSVSTWDTTQQVLLAEHVISGPNDPALLAVADGLTTGGGTNLSAGLAKGYAMAYANYSPNHLNRLVLISDGEANVGETDATLIGAASHMADGEGIYLVGVNVGDAIGDPMMNIVTDSGRGASVFIDTEAEALRMFSDRFDETMDIAARGVRLELTVPWYFRQTSFSGEQSSTKASDVEPQHLAPGDAMVFHQSFSACSPSVVNLDDRIGAKATWQTPVTFALREDETSATLGELLAASAKQLTKGKAIYAYAVAMRDADSLPDPAARKLLQSTHALVEAANPGGDDPALSEIAQVLTSYIALF